MSIKRKCINLPGQLIVFEGSKGKKIGVGVTKNGSFSFDPEDAETISNYWWETNKSTKAIQANTKIDGKTLYLHRYIMGRNNDINGLTIDHLDHNRTHNTKENLKICTQGENNRNQIIQKNNTSGVIGVGFYNHSQKWYAKIGIDNKSIFLGQFANKEDAVKARLETEKLYYGDSAPQAKLFAEYNI